MDNFKGYLIKTAREGNYYKIVGEAIPDGNYTWIFKRKGRRNVVLFLGTKISSGAINGFVEPKKARSGILTLDGEIGDLLESGQAVEHQVFFVDESIFPNGLTPDGLPIDYWNQSLRKKIQYTSRIIKIYKRIH